MEDNETLSESALTGEDIFAGLSLLLFGLIGLIFSLFVTIVLFRLAKMPGFRILLSETIANDILAFQFGIWPGIIILLQHDPLPESWRSPVNAYTDFTSFIIYEHQILVGWSRFVAIQWPFWFVQTFKGYAYPVCGGAYAIALIMAIVLQILPWYPIVYYDPQVYGFNCADWSGVSLFWNIYNPIMITTPLVFYALAVAVFVRKHRKNLKTTVPIPDNSGKLAVSNAHRGSQLSAAYSDVTEQTSNMGGGPPSKRTTKKQTSTEKKLLLPCVIHSLTFVTAHFAYQVASKYVGKWGGWLILIMFMVRSFIGPVLLVTMSQAVRNEAWALLKKN